MDNLRETERRIAGILAEDAGRRTIIAEATRLGASIEERIDLDARLRMEISSGIRSSAPVFSPYGCAIPLEWRHRPVRDGLTCVRSSGYSVISISLLPWHDDDPADRAVSWYDDDWTDGIGAKPIGYSILDDPVHPTRIADFDPDIYTHFDRGCLRDHTRGSRNEDAGGPVCDGDGTMGTNHDIYTKPNKDAYAKPYGDAGGNMYKHTDID